ncbi:MAG: hypothetical protein ACFE9R_09935 [Candidatus Hermodarchaeota archaeon]
MLNIRLRNNLFVLFSLLAILILILISPVASNLVGALSFRYAETTENYRTDYSDGYGNVIVKCEIDSYREERYYWAISCYFQSGGAVEIVGIKQLNYSVDIGGSEIYLASHDWAPPLEQFTFQPVTLLRLTKNDIISWTGIIEVQYVSNSILQTETHEFVLRIVVPMGSQDYFNLQIISNFVFFLWLLSFPGTPIILNFIIKPGFSVPLDDVHEEKERKYFEFFKKGKEKQD